MIIAANCFYVNIVGFINLQVKFSTLCCHGQGHLWITTSDDRVGHLVKETGANWCAHFGQRRFCPCQCNSEVVNTCDLKVCWLPWDCKVKRTL